MVCSHLTNQSQVLKSSMTTANLWQFVYVATKLQSCIHKNKSVVRSAKVADTELIVFGSTGNLSDLIPQIWRHKKFIEVNSKHSTQFHEHVEFSQLNSSDTKMVLQYHSNGSAGVPATVSMSARLTVLFSLLKTSF